MVAAKMKSKLIMPGIGRGPKKRPARVADTIRVELGLLLLQKINDPRLQHVTITKVTVTDDLRHAKIFYSILGEEAAANAAAGLASAKGFIRSHLAKELNMRYVPELEFRQDLTLSRQEEMERLFKEIEEENDSAP